MLNEAFRNSACIAIVGHADCRLAAFTDNGRKAAVAFNFQPFSINPLQRIAKHVPISVGAAKQPNRIALTVPSCAWIVAVAEVVVMRTRCRAFVVTERDFLRCFLSLRRENEDAPPHFFVEFLEAHFLPARVNRASSSFFSCWVFLREPCWGRRDETRRTERSNERQ